MNVLDILLSISAKQTKNPMENPSGHLLKLE